MDNAHREYLVKLFGLRDAPPPAPPGERLFVWNFAITGGELPGWRPHRVHRLELPGVPNALQSVWTAPEGGAMLRLDTLECDSAQAAREALLEVLGEYQHAESLLSTTAAGEVMLVAENRASAVFTRGNLVLQLRNAGRTVVPVDDEAKRLDAAFSRRPANLAASRFTPDVGKEGGHASIPLEAALPERGASPVTLRLFANDAEVRAERGGLLLVPTGADPRVEWYATEGDVVGGGGLAVGALG
jgi:hypothetical protein